MREVTLRYTNVADKTESTARRQRVILGEKENLMAKTAEGIIATATQNLTKDELLPSLHTVVDRLEPPNMISPLPQSLIYSSFLLWRLQQISPPFKNLMN